MARHIVCVLDQTVGHVSICWDYVSTFLCNKNMCFASHLVVPGFGVEMINLVICLMPRSSEYPELCVCCVAVRKEDQQILLIACANYFMNYFVYFYMYESYAIVYKIS